MKTLVRTVAVACEMLIVVAVAGLVLPPPAHARNDRSEVDEADESPGRDDEHRADPCEHWPDPPGEGRGHDEKCPLGGSSSGIAKADFNGDGFADLAVGVPDEDVGSLVDAGLVNVIYGSEDGLAADDTAVRGAQVWNLSSASSRSAASGDRFGAALAAGDFNGDGFSDLAIGAPNRDLPRPGDSALRESGAVVVIFGSSNGLTINTSSAPAPQYMDMSTAGLDDLVGAEGAHFGFSLAWGNFNGDQADGRDVGDLAIGIPDAYQVNDLFSLALGVGAVWVVLGDPAGGLDLTFDSRGFLTSATPVQKLSQLEGARFGAALTAGDFFGHGVSSLAVGEPGRLLGAFRDGKCFQNCRPRAGMVQVFDSLFSRGVRLVNFFTQDAQANGVDLPDDGETDDRFGQSLATGGFDGDDIDHLVIGVPGETRDGLAATGAVHVLHGVAGSGLAATGNQFLTLASLNRDTNEAGARFGFALAGGDFNGDSRDDLAIGVPFRDVSGVRDAGQVKVIYGSGSGLSPALVRDPQTWTISNVRIAEVVTPRAGEAFGASLTAWNFGHNVESGVARNPTADLAIGVPFKSVNGISGAGAAVVLYGSVLVNGLTSSFSQFLHQDFQGVPGSPDAGDHFGAALY